MTDPTFRKICESAACVELATDGTTVTLRSGYIDGTTSETLADAILALPEMALAAAIVQERYPAVVKELKVLKGQRILSVIFGHHKGAAKPFALQRRVSHELVALGAEFPDGAVALRLANDGGWTTFSDGGADQLTDPLTEILWLSDELEPLAEMEQQRDAALKVVEAAQAALVDLRTALEGDEVVDPIGYLETLELRLGPAVDGYDAAVINHG